MQIVTKKKISLAALARCYYLLWPALWSLPKPDPAEAAVLFRRAPQLQNRLTQSQPRQTATNPAASPMGGSFARGLAGGIMGGFLGSMLFGGMAHGMGAGGGIGGSGIGLFEILLLAGLGYLAYRWFSRRKALATNTGAEFQQDQNSTRRLFSGLGAQQVTQESPGDDPLVAGVKEIWAVDQDFDPEAFKETAQDLFFKIQAGWTRRETGVLKDFVGDQLLSEYGNILKK
jgi:predicted lipid-binding transport protein (Tim44 family)